MNGSIIGNKICENFYAHTHLVSVHVVKYIYNKYIIKYIKYITGSLKEYRRKVIEKGREERGKIWKERDIYI